MKGDMLILVPKINNVLQKEYKISIPKRFSDLAREQHVIGWFDDNLLDLTISKYETGHYFIYQNGIIIYVVDGIKLDGLLLEIDHSDINYDND